jgi:signal transduction histidine kinase
MNFNSVQARPYTPPSKIDDPLVQIISLLAHEVRNPLNNISLSVDFLEDSVTDSELRSYLDIISRNTKRINSLITDMLRCHKLEDKLEEESVHDMIDHVLLLAGDRARLKSISVVKDFTDEDFRALLNKPKIEIALTNIVINAIESMNSGGKLVLSTSFIEGHYQLQVRDNGCGISKRNLKNIFKPYFTQKPGGLGLGLATTLDILQSSQVGINVESALGKGTCFSLTFPNDNYNLVKN